MAPFAVRPQGIILCDDINLISLCENAHGLPAVMKGARCSAIPGEASWPIANPRGVKIESRRSSYRSAPSHFNIFGERFAALDSYRTCWRAAAPKSKSGFAWLTAAGWWML